MSTWAALTILAGGLFSGGAATFAWSRVPVWRTMPTPDFLVDFAQTIRRTDKVQPALLIVAIIASAGLAITDEGLRRVLALIGAAGYAAVLLASVVVMVPLQRRIIATEDRDAVDDMRERWFIGNLGRSALSVFAFAAMALAVATD